jgi:DNA primase
MNTWIDFKELRARLDFEQVLRRYGVEVKRKGGQHHGYCPLPDHKGKKNSPSFSANLERGVFHCFGCGATGNILEFAALMENVNPEDGSALRKVALKLKDEFCPDIGTKSSAKKTPVAKTPPSKAKELPVVVNQPLDFELKGLDRTHPYLASRGFSRDTIAQFGLGYCERGLLKDRIAIPLHDAAGRLVGYCGRVVDDKAISEENPRYRFPSKREKDERVFEFRKQAFVYNGYRITAPVDDLIVVEGFTSVWWLHQNGLPRVVAVMGADCSEKQGELIAALTKPTGRIWLMPDGNKAGLRCAQSLLTQISPYRFTRWVKLDGETQPTDLSANELKTCFKP